MRGFFFLLIFLNHTVCAANWEYKKHSHNASQEIIVETYFGHNEIHEAFQDVPDGVTIKHIVLGRLVQLKNKKLQNEIMSFYEKTIPAELNSALASSGNLHNPALKPLKAMFNAAIMQTDYIKELNTKLLKRGYQVIKSSHEKFFIIKQGGNLFDAMIWLLVEKSPNKQFNSDMPPRHKFCAESHKIYAATSCRLTERYAQMELDETLTIVFVANILLCYA